MGSEPLASRPSMPGYGVAAADAGDGLLPWSWATERLDRTRDYWVSTVSADGAPHAMAVWGIWFDDRFVFSTGGRSRKARNLAADPRCVVTTDQADEAIVVEGTARSVTDPDELAPRLAAYAAKYGEEPPDVGDNPVFEVQPTVVFAFCESGDRFLTTPTRWRFEGR